ncbi:MAG TPA: sialidase family protein [Candidatus Dormibacteraeota bacterium]|nr:sialidase family protein [Candidatus Dormibacteraeota bacterium]
MVETQTGSTAAAEDAHIPAEVGATRRGGSRRRVLALASALLAVAAITIAALGLRGGHDLVPGPNVAITGADPSAIIDANNSPTVAINPVDTRNLVVVDRLDRPGFSAALRWSRDAGASWTQTALPLPAGRDRPYAPDIAFDPAGILYVLYVNLEGSGNDPQTVWLSRSNDGGRTLQAPVSVTGRLSFQARLAVDGRGHVYVTWLHATEVGNLSIVGPAPVVLCATSSDGGATFAAPVQVSDPPRQDIGAPVPIVDADGNVDVLYEDFNGDVRDFQSLDGPPWQKPFSLVVSRSTTQGKTFAPGVVVDDGLVASDRFLVYLPRFNSIAAAPDHSLYVAWADARKGSDAVFLRRSTDGGQTWGAAVTVPSGATGAGVSAWLPKVTVAPNGRVDVVFLAGQRGTGNGLVDAYLASSDDSGSSFSTARLSTASFNSRIGPETGPSFLAPDLGSRLGADSTDAATVAVWTDTRQGTTDTGRQDIDAATVDMPSTGVSTGRLVLVVVLLAGALAAAVPVLLGARAARDA